MFKKHSTKSSLDEAIEEAISELRAFDASEDGYTQMVDNVVKLHALKQTEKPERVSKDTVAIVVGNLLGIAIIVGHERAHVVTSKALNFVMKAR